MSSTGVPKLIVKRFRSWPRLKLPKEIIAEQQAKQPPSHWRSTTRRPSMVIQARKALRRHVYLIVVWLCAGVVTYGIVSAVAASPQPDDQIEIMMRPYAGTRGAKPLVQPDDRQEKCCNAPNRKKQTEYRTIKSGNLVLHVPKEKEDLTPALSSYELDQRKAKGQKSTRSGKKKHVSKK